MENAKKRKKTADSADFAANLVYTLEACSILKE